MSNLFKSVGGEDYMTVDHTPTGTQCLIMMRDDEMYLYADEEFWLIPEDRLGDFIMPRLSTQGCGGVHGS